jgi:hypothetical protein
MKRPPNETKLESCLVIFLFSSLRSCLYLKTRSIDSRISFGSENIASKEAHLLEHSLYPKTILQFTRFVAFVTHASATGRPEFIADGWSSLRSTVKKKGKMHSGGKPAALGLRMLFMKILMATVSYMIRDLYCLLCFCKWLAS